MAKKIDINLLKERLEYDENTGIFRWKEVNVSRGIRGDLFGKVAGSYDKKGYIVIRLNMGLFKAHRLAWAYVYGECPEKEIDHINGIKDDNRIKNLRKAETQQNCANKGKNKNNTTGYKGVTFNKRIGKYHAKIKYKWKDIHVGYFANPEDAHLAYIKKFTELNGEYSCA